MIDGFLALYIFMLAAFTGKEIIGRVPVILHTPLMSGSNFVHGIVLVGAMVALANADSPLAKAIGFIGVALGAGRELQQLARADRGRRAAAHAVEERDHLRHVGHRDFVAPEPGRHDTDRDAGDEQRLRIHGCAQSFLAALLDLNISSMRSVTT